MMFSTNTTNMKKGIFFKHLNISITRKIQNLLGIPTQIGKYETQTFSFIMERVIQKLKNWKVKIISYVGRVNDNSLFVRYLSLNYLMLFNFSKIYYVNLTRYLLYLVYLA